MIFAELQYDQHYSEVHDELVDILAGEFPDLQHGLQGDSWIWLVDGNDKVSVDSFSSMQHQVKCASASSGLLRRVIEILASRFELFEYAEAELEAHEDG